MIKLDEAEDFLLSNINTFLKKKDYSEVYISGGWVRDKIIKRPTIDIDIILKKEEIQNFLKDLEFQFRGLEMIKTSLSPLEEKKKKILWKYNSSFVINEAPLLDIEVFCVGLEYISETEKIIYKLDIREILENDLKKDIEGRDFRINAMYYEINNYKLVDLVNGLEDLKKKQISLVASPEYTFNQSQSRFFRVVRFKIKFGFEISEVIKKFILDIDFRELYENVGLSSHSFVVTIRKIFKSKKTAEMLEYMKELNIHLFFQFELEKEEFEEEFDKVIFLIKKIEKLLSVEKNCEYLEKYKIKDKIASFEERLKIFAFSFVFFKKYQKYSEYFLTKIFFKDPEDNFIRGFFTDLEEINKNSLYEFSDYKEIIYSIINLVDISNRRMPLNLLYFLDCIQIDDVQNFFEYYMKNIKIFYFKYQFEFLKLNEISSEEDNVREVEEDSNQSESDF